MKENMEFTVITKFKKIIIIIDDNYCNVPKSEYYIKEKIMITCYDILELIYKINQETHRLSLFYELFAKIKMLDFSIKISMDKGIISYKKFISIGTKLNEIVRMMYGWRKSEETKNKV